VPLPPQVGPSTAAAVPADTPGRYVQSRQKGRGLARALAANL